MIHEFSRCLDAATILCLSFSRSSSPLKIPFYQPFTYIYSYSYVLHSYIWRMLVLLRYSSASTTVIFLDTEKFANQTWLRVLDSDSFAQTGYNSTLGPMAHDGSPISPRSSYQASTKSSYIPLREFARRIQQKNNIEESCTSEIICHSRDVVIGPWNNPNICKFRQLVYQRIFQWIFFLSCGNVHGP